MAGSSGAHGTFKELLSNASKPNAVYQQKKLVDLIHIMIDEEESEYPLKRVAELLKAGVDPSLADYLKEIEQQWGPPRDHLPFISPIHYASEQGRLKLTELLLTHNADPNAWVEWDGQLVTPVHRAASRGSIETLEKLIEFKGDIHAKTREPREVQKSFSPFGRREWRGNTVLHECLRQGETECVKQLVHLGADVSYHNQDDVSPVHLALELLSKDTIELLILKGQNMDFDRQHPDLETPLDQVMDRSTGDQLRTNLAVFFLQMGASRRNLKALLWQELNRDEKAGPILKTLMDSFAYLPSISSLKQGGGKCDIEFTQGFFSGFSMSWPQTKVVKKKLQSYRQRRKDVPKLIHLSRSIVRDTLKAHVREVISFPMIPLRVKEHILLGYSLTKA